MLRSLIPLRLLLALLALCVAACGQSPPSFESVDITGADYAREFTLRDTSGATRTLTDFRGKAVVIFFGYTQCPDVCPTTMTDLAQTMNLLGDEANRVQVLFVTLDPERDTPKVLSAYVPNFDARFLGLYGSPAQTEDVTREFKIFYQKVDGPTPTSYTIDHTAGSYVIDPTGKVRLFVRNGEPPEAIAHDLKILLG